MTLTPRPIGGFFESHPAPSEPPAGPSLLEAWTGDRSYAAYVNARSAFAALIGQLEPGALWLPAFLCPAMVSPTWADRVKFYGVGPGFVPDLVGVEAEAATGDLLLVMASFGMPVAAEAEAVIARRPDLHVVEDRAQALDAGPPTEGRWLLYSPRKLLGVADGGLLVAPDRRTETPGPEATDAAEAGTLWRAPDLRAADTLGQNNVVWHAANQTREAAMGVSRTGMTARSLALLQDTPIQGLADRRRRNWQTLDARLETWSALSAHPTAAPLGYVLDLDPGDRDRLREALIRDRVFPAVHWRELASPAEAFPHENAWTKRLLTLPCDHRYDEADMARIADIVVRVLA